MGLSLFQLLDQVDLPQPKGILQVGASYGQEFKAFLDHGVEFGVLVEPLPEPYSHLSSLCRQVPGFVAFNALCSDNAGEKHSFNIASNGGMSSSIYKPKAHLEMFDYVKFDRVVEIVATTAH